MTKPYQVVVSCEGNGELTITVASPDVNTQIVMCTATPQTQTVTEFSPKIGQKVDVNVAAAQGVAWEGIVEIQQ